MRQIPESLQPGLYQWWQPIFPLYPCLEEAGVERMIIIEAISIFS